MMRFEHIEYLYGLLLLLLPATAFIAYAVWRVQALSKYGDKRLIEMLMPERSKYKVYIKFGLLTLAFSAFVLAMANPQIGKKVETVKLKGADVFVAIDVSNSMMAEDLKPNRIGRAKQFVSKLVERMKNDRVGLIVFAGHSYIQMPLTSDKAATKIFLNSITTDMVPTQGTSLADAIRIAVKSFNEDEAGKFKALIILSDGEDHEGEALVAAEEAEEVGVVIHTIGIGNPKGAPIPITVRGKVDFKRDSDGSIVLSKLNELILQQVAASANGKYFRMGNGTEELNYLISELEGLEKRELSEKQIVDYKSYYYLFVLIGFVLLILEFLMAERRSNWIRSLNLFGNQDTKA
ncbi:VWA domain-containing protein [soil metagenome]